MSALKGLEVAKQPGFYEFVNYGGCYILVTRGGAIHYGDKSRNKITNPNWDHRDKTHNIKQYQFKPVSVPTGFDFGGHATSPNDKILLLCSPSKRS